MTERHDVTRLSLLIQRQRSIRGKRRTELTRPITLSHLSPAASGKTRDVYRHPDDETLLVKVIRADAIEKRYGRGRPWYKTTRRYRHFISYLREIREEIALRAQLAQHPDSLQKVVGFADTDLGFGLVVEAERDREGTLAPTLPELIEAGRYDARTHAELKACLDELKELPVVLADVHGDNLVYAWSPERGNHFVLIDGIGCKTLIPFNSMSRFLNRRHKHRRLNRLLGKIEKQLAERGLLPQNHAPAQALPQAAE